MHKLELLLRKYENNFLLLDDIINNQKIEYLNFNNIITVTDTNLSKIPSVKKVINYLQNNYNTKIIELSSGEPNYEMIESTSKEILALFIASIVFRTLSALSLLLMFMLPLMSKGDPPSCDNIPVK